MKITKIAFGLIAAASAFMIGCATTQTMNEESIGLRKTDLYSENTTVGDRTEYIKEPAGQSKLIERAFENAPPMIPHDVEGMLPITINNNACTSCHAPEIAKSMNATPIPKSHFTNYRPDTSLAKDGSIVKEGKIVDNTSDFKLVSKKVENLAGARFNCSQCHAPQSIATQAPKNEFKADFRAEDLNKVSNFADSFAEGVDTLK